MFPPSAYGSTPDFALQESLDTVLYFLNRMAHCADTSLCSGEIADRFFLDYARTFWAHFSEEYALTRPDGAEPLVAYLAARDEAGRTGGR